MSGGKEEEEELNFVGAFAIVKAAASRRTPK